MKPYQMMKIFHKMERASFEKHVKFKGPNAKVWSRKSINKCILEDDIECNIKVGQRRDFSVVSFKM